MSLEVNTGLVKGQERPRDKFITLDTPTVSLEFELL